MPDSNAIARQRKRILDLKSRVADAQRQRVTEVEEEEEDEVEEEIPKQNAEPTNEPLAGLRNRLFAGREDREEGALNTSTEHVLQHHRMLQDELSDAMLGMARGLKARSVAFGQVLEEDSKVLLLYLPWVLMSVNRDYIYFAGEEFRSNENDLGKATELQRYLIDDNMVSFGSFSRSHVGMVSHVFLNSSVLASGYLSRENGKR